VLRDVLFLRAERLREGMPPNDERLEERLTGRETERVVGLLVRVVRLDRLRVDWEDERLRANPAERELDRPLRKLLLDFLPELLPEPPFASTSAANVASAINQTTMILARMTF